MQPGYLSFKQVKLIITPIKAAKQYVFGILLRLYAQCPLFVSEAAGYPYEVVPIVGYAAVCPGGL